MRTTDLNLEALRRTRALELLKLLSALESWSFAISSHMPDHLQNRLADAIDQLTKEVLQ